MPPARNTPSIFLGLHMTSNSNTSTILEDPFAVSIEQAIPLVIHTLKRKKTPMLHSSPGVGKSSMAREIAKRCNLFLIDVRLIYFDPIDMKGFLSPNADRTAANYIPVDMWPFENTPVPEGYSGWLIFFDELPSAVPTIQKAAYEVIQDHQIAGRKLHPKALKMVAGNLITDNADVYEINTALQSRMIHLKIKNELSSFVINAHKNDFDYRVISFYQAHPDLLTNFNPNHSDFTFSCPRTAEFLSDLVKNVPDKEIKDLMPLLAGTVSPGVATAFLSFIDCYTQIVTIDQILADPLSCNIPSNAHLLYALTGRIGHYLNNDNAEILVKYIKRLPSEYQYLILTHVQEGKPSLIDQNTYVKDLLNDIAINMVI